MTQRTCDEPGCGRAHRARGLCSTHYNHQHQPNRNRKVQVDCGWCGKPCYKEPSRIRQASIVLCSPLCVASWRSRGATSPVIWTPCSACGTPNLWWTGETCQRARCRVLARPRPTIRAPHLFVAGTCCRCGTGYVTEDYTDKARYCSARCQRKDAKARRRARLRDGYVADVSRTLVFIRDGWRCQLCRRKVRRGAVVPHPEAPVLDHIVPLARGGTHEPANVQCAHFRCNSLKGHRGSGEQLRLIG